MFFLCYFSIIFEIIVATYNLLFLLLFIAVNDLFYFLELWICFDSMQMCTQIFAYMQNHTNGFYKSGCLLLIYSIF